MPDPLSIPTFKAFEQYGFRRVKLEKSAPNIPGWSAYESKSAGQTRKELRETFGCGR